jgi:hypothetical protein
MKYTEQVRKFIDDCNNRGDGIVDVFNALKAEFNIDNNDEVGELIKQWIVGATCTESKTPIKPFEDFAAEPINESEGHLCKTLKSLPDHHIGNLAKEICYDTAVSAIALKDVIINKVCELYATDEDLVDVVDSFLERFKPVADAAKPNLE